MTLGLTANALDARRAGGTVTVTLAARADAIELVVAADGPGMVPAVLARVFEPLFTTKPPGHGVGLGLAVAHGVVTVHGGTIDVDSAPGRGACFTVRLPPR